MTHLLEILTTPITYVEFALVLFLSIFLSILAREFVRSRKEVTRMAALPLESDSTPEEPHE